MLKRISRLVTIVLLFMILSSPLIVRAAEELKPGDPNSKRGLILSPLVQTLQGERGQTVTATYTLTNDFETVANVDVYPWTANFIQDEEGLPVIDDSERELKNDFAKWFVLEAPKVTLAHNERREFTYKVNIPDDAAPGTHSALILFPRTESERLDNGEDIVVGAKDQLGLPVLLTIGGEINFQSGEEESSMYISDILNVEKTFFTGGTARVNVNVNNPSNIYILPYGNVFIHKGDKANPIEQFEFNPNDLTVQQNNKRNFRFDFSTGEFITQTVNTEGQIENKLNWGKFFDFKFGKHYATYQARVKPAPEAGLGDEVIVYEQTADFYIFPIQFIIMIITLLVVIVGFVIYRTIAGKSKKSNTIARTKKK